MSAPELQYVDFTLLNDTTMNAPAYVRNTRNIPYLKNPSEYNGTVVRFTVDANWPLFIPQYTILEEKGVPHYVTNISLTLTYNASTYQRFVEISADEAKNGVFDFGVFFSELNAAASDAYLAMFTEHPGIPAAYPPYFALDPKTSLISMYVDDGWLDNEVTPCNIWFSTYLQDLVNLPTNFRLAPPQPNGMDYQIAVKGYSNILPPVNTRANFPYDLNARTATLLQVSQEFVQLSTFSDIATIAFTTTAMPIVPEFLPVRSGIGQNSSTISDFVPIITDIIIAREDGKPRDSSFVYLPTAEYRRFELVGDIPLTTIDVKAYYTTYDGVLHDLMLPPGGSMTLKLLFEKKK